ncbi:MAG: hypothetical protein WAM14_18770 [Candidatus Nitrosopolaris sp.]
MQLANFKFDFDYLPEYALKENVRWSMNSKQGSRYIKRRMGKLKMNDNNPEIPPNATIKNYRSCQLKYLSIDVQYHDRS